MSMQAAAPKRASFAALPLTANLHLPNMQENLPPGGGRIAGVRVVEGSIQRSAPLVRVIRNGQLVYEVCMFGQAS